MLGRLAGTLALVCALSPPVAHAGTLSYGGASGFHYEAAPGEANDVKVYRAPSGALAVEDHGAPMDLDVASVGAAYVCLPVKRGYHCQDPDTLVNGYMPRVSLTLGDQDDGLVARTWIGTVDAGEGADSVETGTGPWGDTRVDLGPGDDRLRALVGPYASTFDGGGGDDTLAFEGPSDPPGGCCDGAQAFATGGEGNDRVTSVPGRHLGVTFTGGRGADASGPGITWHYDEPWRTTGVVVTADGVPGDGEAGEGDDVADGANVVGSPFADVLRLGTRPATLLGRDGDDELSGGTAAGDHLHGDGGHDRIHARDGLHDYVSCGAGDDWAEIDAVDTHYLHPACETVA